MNRRHFLMGAATAAEGLRSSSLASPNDTVRVACVGLRGRGQNHITAFSKLPNVEVAALCDVDERILKERVDLAESMIRAIARQAEAERERRAKIIHAEGEYTAAEKLAMAAEVIQKQPAAIQLRYLQTLTEIGVEKNTTIVFPLPLDIIASLGRALDRAGNDPGKGTP